MKFIVLFLLLVEMGWSQCTTSLPTASIKKKHQGTATVRWDFDQGDFPKPLLYFSLKSTPDIGVPGVEFKQVPKTERSTQFVVIFTPQFPKTTYYMITAIYDGAESCWSNTVEIDRVGPPPQ